MSIPRKETPILQDVNSALVDLPTPSNLFSWWNCGSLLGLMLMTQITTGILLAMHYKADVSLAFDSVSYISREVFYGWLIQNLHANGASFFFICLYLHIGRGLYYGSYLNTSTWTLGIVLLLLSMMTAFMGYILPWGQMSFWAATVITSLISTIPYIGKSIMEWIWGGFSVDDPTLTRLFTLHFIMPFVIIGTMGVHLATLHQSGSNNPTGFSSALDMVPLHPYFTIKDIMFGVFTLLTLTLITLLTPNLFIEPENFIKANPMVTPTHIKPEWYFLFIYAILRTPPAKVTGVVLALFAIMGLALMPVLHLSKQRSLMYRPISQFLFWTLAATIWALTWAGGTPLTYPMNTIGAAATIAYFTLLFIIMPIAAKLENSV
ncbi:cytochrome b (mitochondrion) [Pogona vitticeps]|uniref:Cytochrome b n=1 Tax=Pogona vitticeps TaxID=103695 RepID=Q5CD53_9SAUR|nr:cytochrome b [Pogona vitticeps]BAD90959.1 cytochrome b [Pogona vitticeps]